MAKIVSIHAVSHTPVMINFPDAVGEEERQAVYQAFQRFGEQVLAARPDVLLILSDDHVHNFFLNNLPAFCIGAANAYPAPIEHWLKVEKRVLKGDTALGTTLLEKAFAKNFDPALSMELTLDHGFITPLELSGILKHRADLPIVPIMINCVQPPMPKMARCYDFGVAIAEALMEESSDKRIAVIASGGISHDLSTPRMGMINEEFDRQFVAHLSAGEANAAIEYATQHVHLAGNGAEEVRMWLMAMGMSKALVEANPLTQMSQVSQSVNGHAEFQLDFYKALTHWYTGIGLGHWKV